MPNLKMSDFPIMSMDALPGGVLTFDKNGTGMAFLVGELEKREEKLKEPLAAVTWPRDMPVKTGGGWVENIASFNVSYGSSGGSAEGLLTGESNELPIIQADIEKDSARVFIWGQIVRIPMIDQQKLQQVGRSLDQIFDKGLHLAHDKEIDKNVYVGYPKLGTRGLINHAAITTVVAAPHTSGGSDTQWSKKNADEILVDINRVLYSTIQASGNDNRGMANHILIPWKQYSDLVVRKVDEGSGKSIMTYLMENNIATKQGIDLKIEPCPWCEGAGTSSTDRLAAYRNNTDMVNFQITVPLRRLFTQPSAEKIAYLSPYVTQYSQVIFEYLSHAMYMDGI